MMKKSSRFLYSLILTLSIVSMNNLSAKAEAVSSNKVEANPNNKADEILVTVNKLQVTAADLERAVRSAPFATQFNTLQEQEQASLRGGLLQRLVAGRLMLLEAQAQKLDETREYRGDETGFHLGLLHRRYMDHLRSSIKLPEDVKKQMKAEFKGNYDAYKAARSGYISDIYKQARIDEIRRLRKKYNVHIFEDRISTSVSPETVLMQGDEMQITFGNLPKNRDGKLTKEWIEHQLYIIAELKLTSRAALDAGFDVSKEMKAFRSERLTALLAENLEKQWLPDEKPLKAYFDAHPLLSRLLERRHIGQLVLATREEAEAMRKRILAGESLFALAGQYSIDPYGRSHNGDMGWIKEDRGSAIINKAIAELKDNEISQVIKTPIGFHLVTILERKPGEKRTFNQVKDKVRQMYLGEKLDAYLKKLEEKYQVVWHILEKPEKTN